MPSTAASSSSSTPLGLEEEIAADRAQPQLARVAVDELHAQCRLELLDPAGQRRLRQVQRIGGSVEAAELGHGHEAAQVVQVGFHARHASFIQIIAFHIAASASVKVHVKSRRRRRQPGPAQTAGIHRCQKYLAC